MVKWYRTKVGMYIVNILLAVDQFVNVLMLGDPDETMSSRAGRVWGDTWWARFIDALFFWQSGHTYRAIERDEGRRDILFPSGKYPARK